MKTFSCAVCGAILFFENTACLACGSALGYIPERASLRPLEQAVEPMLFLAKGDGEGGRYRKCQNYGERAVCNWMVRADDPDPHCRSCRLSRTIPDLSTGTGLQRWRRLEAAKRRLVYELIALGLPMPTKAEDAERGLAFDFLADADGRTVMTGHDAGVITINCAEADDSARERTRAILHEDYRTLLGHFRHESGHYYWDRLIRDGGDEALEKFRARFGDERQDYARAQHAHYQGGPRSDWESGFISAYASMHPWEDWAETWAHYLHMVDVVETGAQFGLSLASGPADRRAERERVRLSGVVPGAFDQLVAAWQPLTQAVNSLNRSMGLADWYPFAPSLVAIDKLRFVHQVIGAQGGGARTDRGEQAAAAVAH